MAANNLDKNIIEALRDREITPSNSAWERLKIKLDEEESNKKKKYISYGAYVATLALIITISITQFSKEKREKVSHLVINVEKEFIATPNDLEDKIIITEVQKNNIGNKGNNKKKIYTVKNKDLITSEERNKDLKQVEISISLLKKDTLLKSKKNKKRIQINPNDLLYAVTHTPEEVKKYYAKYHINRNVIIDTLKSQLKKSNLKVDPAAVLAEVESRIEEDDFKENFIDKFKSKLSEVLVAISDKND